MGTRTLAGALILSASWTSLAQAQTFLYRIPNIAADGACHVQAQQLGARFAAVTGVMPMSSRCVDIGPTDVSFEIEYDATAALALVSTIGAIGAEGDYADLESCLNDVAGEASHFQGVTGLTPVVATCQTVAAGRPRPYALRIDSFGDADIRPWTAWTMLVDRPLDVDLEDFEDAVEQSLIDQGIDVRSVSIASGFYGDIYVRYYAADPFQIQVAEFTRVDTRFQCEEQLELARTLSHHHAPPVAIYCARSLTRGYYINGLLRESPRRSPFDSAERFSSYGDCMRDRVALVADYETRMGTPLGGGLCANAGEAWRVRLFSR